MNSRTELIPSPRAIPRSVATPNQANLERQGFYTSAGYGEGTKDCGYEVGATPLSCDLKTRKRTGTSCQIEIHFSIKTTNFLFKYTLLCSQIYDGFIILFIKHNHKVSASFIKEKQSELSD